MAKTIKTKKATPSEAVPKAKPVRLKTRHRQRLRTFAKHLHILGLDVKEHLDDLEMAEEDLADLSQSVDLLKSVNAIDKQKLKSLLKDIISTSKKLSSLDEALFSDVRPLTKKARKIQRHSPPSAQHVLVVEAHVLASIRNEHKLVFSQYPALIDSIERDVSNLFAIEKRLETAHPTLLAFFSQINYELKRLFYDDISVLSEDILETYAMRKKVFRKLVKRAEKHCPAAVPRLKKEQQQIATVSNHYLRTYTNHLNVLNALYDKHAGGMK